MRFMQITGWASMLAMGASPALAHTEVAGEGGLLAVAHGVVHLLQAYPALPVLLAAFALAGFLQQGRRRRRRQSHDQ